MTVEERKQTTRNEICEYLEQGMTKKDSAIMAGIDETTMYRWIRKNASFASRVQRSILKYKRNLILCLNIRAQKDGRTALAILKTRFPEEWNPSRKIEVNDPNKELKRVMRILMGEATEDDLAID